MVEFILNARSKERGIGIFLIVISLLLFIYILVWQFSGAQCDGSGSGTSGSALESSDGYGELIFEIVVILLLFIGTALFFTYTEKYRNSKKIALGGPEDYLDAISLINPDSQNNYD